MIENTTESGKTTAEKMTELAAPLSDSADTVYRTARENVGLTLIGGLAVGLAVGALLPFGRRSKRPKKAARTLAVTLAATLSELSQTLAAQARDQAQSTAGDANEKLTKASRIIGKSIQDNSGTLAKQTKKLADDAADQLNDGGKAIARQLVKLIEKLRH